MWTIIIVLMILAVIVVVTKAVFHKRSYGSSGSASSDSVSKQGYTSETEGKPSKPDHSERFNKYFLPIERLQERIRLDPDFMKRLDMVEIIETVIDEILVNLPILLEEYPSADLTIKLARFSDSYLPDLINRFLDLDPADRNETVIAEQLNMLKTKITEIRAIIRDKRVVQYQGEVDFLEMKFNTGSVEV